MLVVVLLVLLLNLFLFGFVAEFMGEREEGKRLLYFHVSWTFVLLFPLCVLRFKDLTQILQGLKH